MYYNNGPWKKRNNRAKPAEAETNRLGSSKRKYNIYLCEKQRNKKMPVPENVVDFMKNMNPQQLVDFLLSSK